MENAKANIPRFFYSPPQRFRAGIRFSAALPGAHVIVLLSLLSVSATGCQRLMEADEFEEIRPDQLTWVSVDYAGGRKCNPELRFTPPNVMTLLTQNNIYVHEVAVVVHPICEQCDCLYYHGTHYARIKKGQVRQAAEFNFNESAPPPR